MTKTIFVLLDGCGYEAAVRNLGFLEHLTEDGLGARFCVRGELPSLSRPMYETLLTGLPVHRHGIVNNLTVRRSNCENVFSFCRKNSLSTAAAAYYWVSELYCRAPFSPAADRIQLGTEADIQNGIYYFEDCYPDSHVFADAEFLRSRFDPDFLMIHSMNVDDAGHRFTSASREYESAVAKLNEILPACLPFWLEGGCRVLITADHGMNRFGLHGGNTEEERLAPLYLFGPGIVPQVRESPVSALFIAPLLCRMLGLEPGPEMESLQNCGVTFLEK